MEGRGGAVGGEESTLDFQSAMGGFRTGVAGRVGAWFYFS
jgi:hypothetical protein